MPDSGDVIVAPTDPDFFSLTQYTANHNPTTYNDVRQNLYFAALQNQSGHNSWLSWVPTYGNYNGTNANVDAWVKWQIYNDIYGDGSTLTKDSAGQQKIQNMLNSYSSQHPSDDPLHLKPIDSQDWNGFNHDITLVGGVITNIYADVRFAISSFISFITDGNTYSALAAPFIGIIANAAHAVSGVYQSALSIGGGFADGASDLADGFSAGLSQIAGGNMGAGLGSIISGIGNALASIGAGLYQAFVGLFPLVIDLNHDGLDLISIGQSGLAIVGVDGHAVKTGWIGSGEGILAYDENGNGSVDGYKEFGLARFVNGAKSDLEGLRHFDTNHDGIFSALDAEYGKFLVWNDLNKDGKSTPNEVSTLAALGISSISLNGAGAQYVSSGNLVGAQVAVQFTDGHTTTAYDVTLASTNAAGAAGFLTAHAQLTLMPAGAAFINVDDAGSTLTLNQNMLPSSVERSLSPPGAGMTSST